MAAKYISNCLNTVSIFTFPTFAPVNKIEPTGGVIVPIQRFSVTIIPNCTGCIPKPTTIGSRMGVAIKGGNNNEHHNHNDVGSFVVAIGSAAPLLDPGAEIYTARTFSPSRSQCSRNSH